MRNPEAPSYSRGCATAAALIALIPGVALAHGVTAGDKGYIMETFGVRIMPFIYLGAKHMVTGYDHLLFLVGVIFYLYRLKDIALYVTLFALGHSLTLVSGVLAQVQVNAFPATMLFGLCHGLGLATKMLDFELARDGLLPNLLAFNIGVELGQLLALSAILVAMGFWRRSATFVRYATTANICLLLSGVCLVVYQLQAYFAPRPG